MHNLMQQRGSDYEKPPFTVEIALRDEEKLEIIVIQAGNKIFSRDACAFSLHFSFKELPFRSLEFPGKELDPDIHIHLKHCCNFVGLKDHGCRSRCRGKEKDVLELVLHHAR